MFVGMIIQCLANCLLELVGIVDISPGQQAITAILFLFFIYLTPAIDMMERT